MLTKIGVPLGIAGAAGSASGVLSPSPRALVDGGGMLPLVVGGSRPVPSSGRYRGSWVRAYSQPSPDRFSLALSGDRKWLKC
jgi:hypothetical protein